VPNPALPVAGFRIEVHGGAMRRGPRSAVRGRMSSTLRIRILDDEIEVPAGDSILRALQIYALARKLPAYGFTRFCWNARCQQCVLVYRSEDETRCDNACQTEARDGMQVLTLPDVLKWRSKLPVRD
jgi:hypothetical protein